MLVGNAAVTVRPVEVVVGVRLRGVNDEHIRAGRFGNHVRNALGAARGGEVHNERLARFFFLRGCFCKRTDRRQREHQGQNKCKNLLHGEMLLPASFQTMLLFQAVFRPDGCIIPADSAGWKFPFVHQSTP